MEEKEKNSGVLQGNQDNSKDFLDKDVEIDEHEGITIKQKIEKNEINLGDSVQVRL